MTSLNEERINMDPQPTEDASTPSKPEIPPHLRAFAEATRKLAKTRAMLRRATLTKELLDNIEVRKVNADYS